MKSIKSFFKYFAIGLLVIASLPVAVLLAPFAFIYTMGRFVMGDNNL